MEECPGRNVVFVLENILCTDVQGGWERSAQHDLQKQALEGGPLTHCPRQARHLKKVVIIKINILIFNILLEKFSDVFGFHFYEYCCFVNS